MSDISVAVTFRGRPLQLGTLLRSLEPSIQSRIAKGALWSILGAGAVSGFAMVTNVGCARMLGAARFGELGIVMATTNLFTTLFTSGLSMTATRYVAAYRDSEPDRAGKIIGLSTLTAAVVGAGIALLICVFAPLLTREVLKSAGLWKALMLGAAIMFLAALNGSQLGVLSGFEAFNRVAVGNLGTGIATLLLVTAGAAWNGLPGALLGYIGVGTVTAVIYQSLIRRECRKRFVSISYRFGRDDVAVLWRFTLPVLLTTSLFTPAAWWSNVLVARRSGYAEAGVFAAIVNWQMFILFFSNAIGKIALPMLSNIHSQGDGAKYRKVLGANFVLVSAPAIALAIPIEMCAPSIVRLYGRGFEHAAPALMLIAAAAVLTAFNIPVGQVLWSLNATTSAMCLAFLNGITLIIGAYALAGFGAAGLAGAYVIMVVLQTALNGPIIVWLLRKKFAVKLAEEAVVS